MRKSNNKKFNSSDKEEKMLAKSNRSKGRSYKRSKSGNKPDKTNDPSWYGTSPELIRDSASIPFSWPVGTSFNVDDGYTIDSVPGIMALSVQSGIGGCYTENDAVNVASSAIYTYVRHANSGHSNYDAPDLMMYLLAMSSIYSFITWCQRNLAALNTFDQRNRYIPKGILKANSVDYESLRDNQANFRFWLNTFITKVSSLVVPNVMPIFQRLAFLYANIYIDGPTIKDQLYMYVPHGLTWTKFSLDSSQKGH